MQSTVSRFAQHFKAGARDCRHISLASPLWAHYNRTKGIGAGATGRGPKRRPAQAFFYFSIGYAAGFYESACKLGDLFVQGLGIVPNQRIALRLYEEVYDNTRHAFCLGEHTQFADAALRMGNCYSQGIGVAVDHARAYGYDLEANLALAQRAPEDDVGDAMLAADLHRALPQEKQAYDKPCVQPEALPFHTWLLRIKKPFQQMSLR